MARELSEYKQNTIIAANTPSPPQNEAPSNATGGHHSMMTGNTQWGDGTPGFYQDTNADLPLPAHGTATPTAAMDAALTVGGGGTGIASAALAHPTVAGFMGAGGASASQSLGHMSTIAGLGGVALAGADIWNQGLNLQNGIGLGYSMLGAAAGSHPLMLGASAVDAGAHLMGHPEYTVPNLAHNAASSLINHEGSDDAANSFPAGLSSDSLDDAANSSHTGASDMVSNTIDSIVNHQGSDDAANSFPEGSSSDSIDTAANNSHTGGSDVVADAIDSMVNHEGSDDAENSFPATGETGQQ
jgi:lambda repressor-like predicted transcriptional regulator